MYISLKQFLHRKDCSLEGNAVNDAALSLRGKQIPFVLFYQLITDSFP